MDLIIPIIIFVIISLSMIRKIPVYDEFLLGVEDGMKTVISIFPTMLGILTAVAMLQKSGAMSFFINLLSPATNAIQMPNSVMPLAVLRPFSGSGSLGILTDILHKYGADSQEGRIASIIMGSSETTFYTLCVYFKNTRVRKIGKIIPCALLADIAVVIASVWCVNYFF